MLGIKIRHTFLSLHEDTSLAFEWTLPVGLIIDGGDVIHSGYTFPIDIPLDAVNLGVIGHVHRIDLDQVFMTDEYCEVWAQGILLYTGRATIQQSSSTSARLYMIFNEVKPLSDVSLQAIDLGGDREIGADEATRLAHAKATATDPLDYDYVFCPILNPIFNKNNLGLDQTAVFSNLQNHWDTDAGEFVEGNTGSATPFIRVDYLLTQIFKHLGYTLDNQWQTTDELKQLLLYNNFNIYSDNDEWATEINLINHVPYRSCMEFVKAVLGTFALGLFPDPIEKKMSLIPFRDIILSPVHQDITHLAGINPLIETDREYISRFRYDIDTDDALSIDYSGVTFNQTAVSFEGLTVYDLHAALAIGISYIQSDNTYYLMLLGGADPNCRYITQDQKEINRGDTALEYISPLIPMWSSWALGLDGYINSDTSELPIQAWLLPQIRMQGYSLYAELMKKPQTAFRTMYYRGMQPYNVDTIAGTYPMAGVTIYNILGDVVGDHSLLWDVEGGMYDTWWKLPYEMLKNRKTVTRLMRLDIAWLLQFKWQQKYRIENHNVIFTHLRFSISLRGISPVNATMITTL